MENQTQGSAVVVENGTLNVENATVIQPTIVVEPLKKNEVPTSLISLDQTGKQDMSKFTPEQITKFKQRANAISSTDNTALMNFGADVQSKVASSSNTFLSSVRGMDVSDVGTCITDLLTEINYVDIDPSSQPGWKKFLMAIPGLKNVVMNVQKTMNKYDSVVGNIEGIVTKLDQGRNVIIKDNNHLDILFNDNVTQIHNLEELIIVGNIKLEELNDEIKSMQLNAADFEEYEIADKLEFANRLEKRLHDMSLTRMITIQSLPQIRLVQQNNMTMCEKIQQSIVTTIPIWKQQMAIGVALNRQAKNAEIQEKMYAATNTMLAKNAEMLKMNSITVAKQNERGVIDVAVIQKVQQEMIETLNQITDIKKQGEATRREAGKVLENLEAEISKTVLNLQ